MTPRRPVFASSPPPPMWRTRARLNIVPWAAYCRVLTGATAMGRADGSILTNTYGYVRPGGAPRRTLDTLAALLGSP